MNSDIFITLLTFNTTELMIIPDSEDETESQDVTPMWHASTYIAISTAGNLKLTNSAMDVQEVFKDSMLTLENHLIFADAYPDSNPQEKFSFLRKIILNEAEVEAPKVFERLKEDPEYLKVFTETVSTITHLTKSN